MGKILDSNKELCAKYPILIPHNSWTGEIVDDYDYSWTEADNLPKGWRDLFILMCEELQEQINKDNIENFYFTEVKEKYNTMRAYCTGCTEEMYNIINKYEHVSRYICQKCGAPAIKETNGWVTSYCDECLPSSIKNNKDEYEEISFDPIMEVTRYYGNGEKKTVTNDCSYIWNKLFG